MFLLLGSISMSSCATMFAEKNTPVVLVDAPSGLVVKKDNEQLSIQSVISNVAGGGGGNSVSTTTYYAQGVMLSKKERKQKLTLESDGKTAEVEIRLGAGGNWILLDLFTGGLIGWGVDAATGKWRVAKNKYIDVPAVLNGTKSRSQGKLKRTIKRQAKGR